MEELCAFLLAVVLFWCQEKRIIKECSEVRVAVIPLHSKGVFIAAEQLHSGAAENAGVGF